MKPKDIFTLIKDTFSDWSEDKAPRLGAAMAYYTVFALSPLLIVVIAIAGLVFTQQAAQQQIIGQIQGLVGQQGAGFIQTAIEASQKPRTSLIASVLGVVTLLFGAGGLFGQLQDALNTIWEVQPKPGRGIMGMIKDRFLSFTMVLGTGFLLTVSLVLSAALTALGKFVGGLLPEWTTILEIVNFIVSFA